MRKYIDVSVAPSGEQMEMLEKAAQFAIPEDSDLPELSQEDLRQFTPVSANADASKLLAYIQEGFSSAEQHGWISEEEANAILDTNN